MRVHGRRSGRRQRRDVGDNNGNRVITGARGCCGLATPLPTLSATPNLLAYPVHPVLDLVTLAIGRCAPACPRNAPSSSTRGWSDYAVRPPIDGPRCLVLGKRFDVGGDLAHRRANTQVQTPDAPEVCGGAGLLQPLA